MITHIELRVPIHHDHPFKCRLLNCHFSQQIHYADKKNWNASHISKEVQLEFTKIHVKESPDLQPQLHFL
jgi:hypothetical protein